MLAPGCIAAMISFEVSKSSMIFGSLSSIRFPKTTLMMTELANLWLAWYHLSGLCK
jgi:hypothetical protein